MQANNGRGLLVELLGTMFRSPLEREREFYRRYRELSDKINEAPDSITYYVIRGELFMERGEYQRAKADFEMALALAETLDDTAGWVVMEQVMRDRAIYGLQVSTQALPQDEEPVEVEA